MVGGMRQYIKLFITSFDANLGHTVYVKLAGLLGNARQRYAIKSSQMSCEKSECPAKPKMFSLTVNRLNFATALISRISRSHIN